jgi:DNA modification methylase
MTIIKCKIKEYIQPFERCLALSELKALSGDTPVPIDGTDETAVSFRVTTNRRRSDLRSQLAYWETVATRSEDITDQLKSEATSLIARNGVALHDMPQLLPDIIETKLPNKRCLRYATHGLHEYRGKFFPQLVRALINTAAVPKDGVVVDPMCGSGTTLVESVIAGRSTYGLDMNPLSVFLSDVKCQALNIEPIELIRAHDILRKTLSTHPQKGNNNSYSFLLPQADQDYLARWFDPIALAELDVITDTIDRLSSKSIQSVFKLCLSNIIRHVSWQKPDDLRVRKELKSIEKGEVFQRFLEEAFRSTKLIVAFNTHRGRVGLGKHSVAEADARTALTALPDLRGRVDAVITSPPYATALPYLDTDRLSLIYLNLLPRPEHRTRDSLMIGNREVTGGKRNAYWAYYEEHRNLLPKVTRLLIEKIDKRNKNSDAGFRRRNLSALLAKYFFDMKAVIEQQRDLLSDHGTMFMVVGNNRTTAGGEEIDIRTTEQLALIAESIGFRVAGKLSMDMLVSRDIFRNNAMPSEQIITLQKSQ